jgi:mono/diheme cytochrome c family protein
MKIITGVGCAFAGMLLVAVGLLAASPSEAVVGQELSAVELLELGEEIYIDQCLMCHGNEGHGDGPAARFEDPPPRDLTAGSWRYADDVNVAEIERILRQGIDDTGMLPFSEVLSDEELHAVATYVFEKIAPRND